MINIEFEFSPIDFDKDGYVKISSILTHMQNAALADASQYGATRENLLKDNMFFAVYRNILKIKKNIENIFSKYTLVTFQSSHDRMRFVRNYFIYDSDNVWNSSSDESPYEKALIYCDSIWILMDIEKRRLLRADSLNYPIEEFTLPYERPPKVEIDKDSLLIAGQFTGKDYFIDENGHVNNAIYADIISDYKLMKEKIRYFDITYEHEILPEEKIDIFSNKTKNGEKLTGIKSERNTICFCSEIKNNY